MPSKTPITPLRIDADLKQRAQKAAESAGLTLNGWITEAITRALRNPLEEKTKAAKPTATEVPSSAPARAAPKLNRAERRRREKRRQLVLRDEAKERALKGR